MISADHRAITALRAVAAAYPSAWEQLARFRAMRGVELDDWPEWCYVPMAGAYAIVSGGGENRVPLPRIHHVGILTALGAWRMTRGIYRYDATLYDAVRETPLDADLPADILYRLPEWCLYVETPGHRWMGEALAGMWVHLERDVSRESDELRLVLDRGDPLRALEPGAGSQPNGYVCVPVPLGRGSLAHAMTLLAASAQRQGIPMPADDFPAREVAAELAPLVALVLYLCTDAPDATGDGRPGNPVARATRRHGVREFPAGATRMWDVGVRLGAALRRAQEQASAPTESPGHAPPRPHIRRAHWHTFLAGPRTGVRERRLRWLPPLPINVDDYDALPATIHRLSEPS